ncbi:hypothetical protein RA8CHR_01272 [Variovorax sp. RA8]|nr:hypothetical protein RA8CHR_01272 [Variovorax sp. RA8]
MKGAQVHCIGQLFDVNRLAHVLGDERADAAHLVGRQSAASHGLCGPRGCVVPGDVRSQQGGQCVQEARRQPVQARELPVDSVGDFADQRIGRCMGFDKAQLVAAQRGTGRLAEEGLCDAEDERVGTGPVCERMTARRRNDKDQRRADVRNLMDSSFTGPAASGSGQGEQVALEIAGSTLGMHRHICAFFRSAEEENGAHARVIQQHISSDSQTSISRITGHAEWAGEHWPGVEDFLEYEARLNDVVPKGRDTVVCLYDLSKTSASLVADVLRTHPVIILGGVLHENPFFTPVEQFITELRARKEAS